MIRAILLASGDGHQHARFASQPLFEPRTLWRAALARLLHDGAAADDEEAPERAFAHFGCHAELLLATCRSLKRRQTEPSREVAALGKGLGRRRQGGDRGGRDRADAWNGHQPARYFILASTARDLLVEVRYLSLETGEQVQHQSEHGVGRLGK